MKKQILGVLIVVIILMSMLPTTVFAEETTNYDIWVEGKQVTSANQSNVLSKTGWNGATVTYDPTTNTLTLDYAALKSSNGTYNANGSYYVIYFGTASPANPILKVNGICSIVAESSDKTIIGIGASRVKLTIQKATSSSTLGIDVKSEKEYNHGSSAYGIQGGNQLIFDGANVSVVVDGTARLTNGIFVSDYSSPVVTVKNGAYLSLSASGTGPENYALNYNGGGTLSIDDTSTAIFQSDDENCLSTGISLNKDSNGNYTQIILADANRDGVMEAHTSKPRNPYASRIEIRPAVKATLDLSSAGIVNKEAYWAKDVVFPEPEAPVVKGYVFAGWYTNSSYTTAFDFSTKKSTNFTIYAKYIPYDADMQKIRDAIDAAKEELQGKIDNVNSALADKATTLAQAITDLNTAKTNIQTLLEQIDDYADADTALKNELKEYIDDADTAIRTSINALTARVDEIEDKLDGITLTQIATNQTNIANLTTTLNEVKNTVDALDNTFVNNTELTNALADLKGELESADATLKGLITALTARVVEIEDKLDGITLTQIATNQTNIANLTTTLNEVKNTVDALDDTFVNNTELTNALADLKGELKSADATLEGLITALTGRVDVIESKLDGMDLTQIAKNETSIKSLTEELGKLNTFAKDIETNYESADAALQAQITALDTKLTKLIDETIAELTKSVNKLKNDLDTANGNISTNTTNIDTLQRQVSNLETKQTEAQAAIDALEDLTGTQGALQTAIAELKAAVNTANSNIDAALIKILALEGNVKELKAALEKDIKDLQDAVADKADGATTTDALQKLEKTIAALELAKDNYITADEKLKDDLNSLITKAKLDAIDVATDLVNTAKADLEDKLNDKADADTTAVAIKKLEDAIANLESIMDNYIATDSALSQDLAGKIDDAKGTLETAIKKLEDKLKEENASLNAAINQLAGDLSKAQKELSDAITRGDAALSSYIDSVSTSLRSAKAILEQADKDNKAALEAKIKVAEATLDAAIQAVQKNLDDAKEELNQAIENGNAELDSKIANLNAALESTKAALEAADETNKLDLEAALSDAYNSITEAYKKAIGEAQEELEAKVNANIDATAKELAANTNSARNVAITATVVGSIALVSNIALVSWFIKKKRLF